MSQATNYTEERVLTGLVNGTSITLSTGKPYIGLLTSAPNDASGTGTEVSGGGYTRVQVGSTGQGNFTVTDGTAVNDAEFKWDDATGNWGSVSNVALYDSATGGNMLIYGNLLGAVTVNEGDIFKIPASGFTIVMD